METCYKRDAGFEGRGAGAGDADFFFLLIMGHLCCPPAISSVYLHCKLLLMGVAFPKILCLLQKLLTEMPQYELLRAAKSYTMGTKHSVDSPD